MQIDLVNSQLTNCRWMPVSYGDRKHASAFTCADSEDGDNINMDHNSNHYQFFFLNKSSHEEEIQDNKSNNLHIKM